jgi:hypothetical protein
LLEILKHFPEPSVLIFKVSDPRAKLFNEKGHCIGGGRALPWSLPAIGPGLAPMISAQGFLDFRQSFAHGHSARLGILELTEDFNGPIIEKQSVLIPAAYVRSQHRLGGLDPSPQLAPGHA